MKNLSKFVIAGAITVSSLGAIAQTNGQLPGPNAVTASVLQKMTAVEKINKFLPLVNDDTKSSNYALWETSIKIVVSSISETQKKDYTLLTEIVDGTGVGAKNNSYAVGTAALTRVVELSNDQESVLKLHNQFINLKTYNSNYVVFTTISSKVSNFISQNSNLSNESIKAYLSSNSRVVNNQIIKSIAPYLKNEAIFRFVNSFINEENYKSNYDIYKALQWQIIPYIRTMSVEEVTKYMDFLFDSESLPIKIEFHKKYASYLNPLQVVDVSKDYLTDEMYSSYPDIYSIYKSALLTAINSIDDLEILLNLSQNSQIPIVRTTAATRIRNL